MSYKKLDSAKEFEGSELLEQFALDILMGFSTREKSVPSKYFYDDRGSDLFSRITEAPEYYPTKCEYNIFESQKSEIAARMPHENHYNLIELGAGDGRKTKLLLNEFLERKHQFEYVPVDISEAAVRQLSESLQADTPALQQEGVVGEYIAALNWITRNKQGRNVVLFLGSNIGNFSRAQALGFLRTLWKHLNPDDLLLVGFDLKKDISYLLDAYNDQSGVTAEFNLNLLNRINEELGGQFDLSKFQHFGTYNPQKGAMESYLISLEEQTVAIDALGTSFHFRAYEPIHTEYSYKYLLNDINFLAKETGFSIVENFRDEKVFFVDSLWQVKKRTAQSE